MRFVEFAGCAGFVIGYFMLFSTLLLFEQRDQHLLSKNVDLPELFLSQIDCLFALETLGLRVSIHIEFMFVVGEGETVDAKAVAAVEFDDVGERPALFALFPAI